MIIGHWRESINAAIIKKLSGKTLILWAMQGHTHFNAVSVMRLLQIIVCKENIWRDTLWWNHFLTCDQCNMSYKDLTLKTIREYTLGRSYFHVINVARVFFKEIILEHIIVCIPRRSHFHVISGTKVFSHKIPSYKTSKRTHWGEAISM